MALKPGTRLGPYEILAQLGAGGMGEVYKGRDVRLDRLVALKLLAPHLAANREARERFEREATTVAKLKHAHICLLYDIGKDGDRDYLVFEYLEGETLSQRLARGPLALDQVLQYAIEISDALDKAHRAGVTHRDIKPGNIMVVPSSETASKTETKLLDFGLAKLKQAALPADIAGLPRYEWPTGAGAPTEEGRILGTVQYMAPEQVEGKVNELDARTDIFSFGATVYEMATGKKAFQGESQASIMASILKEEPPAVSSLDPPGKLSSPALDRVVKKCLAKEPERRWQAASDLHDELKWIATGGQAGMLVPQSARRTMWDRLGWVAAAVAILIAIVLAVPYFRSPSTTDSNAIRFFISEPVDTDLLGAQMAVSPDGTQVVFLARNPGGQSVLWLRALDSPESRSLAGTEGASAPFWSPDSAYVGFVADGRLKKIPAAGGTVQTIANTAVPRGGTWNAEGTILFTQRAAGGLYRVSEAGGASSRVTTVDAAQGETSHHWPQFLPDGRHFLYESGIQERGGIYIGSLDSPEEKKFLVNTNAKAQYAPPGYLLFMRENTLMAQPFDAERLELTGEPSLIAEGLPIQSNTGQTGFSVSERGVLAYWTGGNIQTRRLVWFDRAGKQLGTVGPPGDYYALNLSPDGSRVAVDVINPQGSYDIWISEVAREVTTRFTFDPATDRLPLWSPDGTRIVFHSNRNTGVYDLYQKSSTGAGSDELVFESRDRKYPQDWSLDGQFLVFTTFGAGPDASADLWVLPMAGDPSAGSGQGRKPFVYLNTAFQETQAQISPDGRWLAYVSNESGRDEVYIQSFPMPGSKRQVSTNGGVQPRWRRDGRELFYLTRDRSLMATPISLGPTLEVGTPKVLFEVPFTPDTAGAPYSFFQYDIMPDGDRFLASVPPENTSVPITVVLNWTAGIRK